MTADQASDVDAGRPPTADIYDCFLGGEDNYPADREAAQAIKENLLTAPLTVKANRAFMRRTVRLPVAEVGIRQLVTRHSSFVGRSWPIDAISPLGMPKTAGQLVLSSWRPLQWGCLRGN